MTINWVEVLASLLWAAGLGLAAASAFIWRMKRHERDEDQRFLDGIRKAHEGKP